MYFGEEYIGEELKSSYEELKKAIKKNRNKMFVIKFGVIVGIVLFLFVIPVPIIAVALFILLLIIPNESILKLKDDYREKFKMEFVEPFLKQINRKIKYDKKAMISKLDYEKSYLFKMNYTNYSGDDYGIYETEEEKIEFSELKVAKVTRDSRGRGTEDIFFEGLFFVIKKKQRDNNENFKWVLGDKVGTEWKTVVKRVIVICLFIFILNLIYFELKEIFPLEYYGKRILFKLKNNIREILRVGLILLGVFVYNAIKKRNRRNKLKTMNKFKRENLKKMTLYSNNEEKVKHYISDELLRIINQFKKETDIVVEVSMVDEDLFIAFWLSGELFEPTLKEIVNEKDFFIYKRCFELVDAIKEELF